MSTSPIFAPDGTLGDIPAGQLPQAVKAGAKPGVNIISPDGKKGVVPADRYNEATMHGAKLDPEQGIDHPGFWAAMKKEIADFGTSAYGDVVGGIKSLADYDPQSDPNLSDADKLKLNENQAAAIAARDAWRKQNGYNPIYRALAQPAEMVGVNVPGAEQAAKEGSEGGVWGHTLALPATAAVVKGISDVVPAVSEAAGTALEKAGKVTPKQAAQVAGGTTGAVAGHGTLSAPGAYYGAKTAGHIVEGVLGKDAANTPIADHLADLWRKETGTPVGAYAGQPEAPSPELLQSRALAQPGTSPVDPSAGLGKLPVHEAPPVYPGAPLPESPPPVTNVLHGPETPPAEVLQARGLEEGGKTPPKSQSAALGDIPISAYLQAEKELGPEASVTSKLERAQTLSQRLDTTLREAVGNKPVEPGVPLKNQGKADISQTTLAAPEGHTPVESSALSTYKYDPTAKEFSVTTPTGGHYIYGDVSPDQASAFENAESKGKAWNDIRQNSTLVAKVIGGKRVPVKSTASASVDPLAQAHDDLTAILQKSLEAAQKKPGASQ